MAGEEGVLAACGAEQSPTDAAEGEGAGGVCAGRRGLVERALELRDALAEGGVGQIQEPADFLASVAGEGEERGEAESGREVRERCDTSLRLAAKPRRSAFPTLRAREGVCAPCAVAATAAGGGAGVEGGTVADNARQPAAGLGRGEVGASRFKRRE